MPVSRSCSYFAVPKVGDSCQSHGSHAAPELPTALLGSPNPDGF
jgi:hypothetical protein